MRLGHPGFNHILGPLDLPQGLLQSQNPGLTGGVSNTLLVPGGTLVPTSEVRALIPPQVPHISQGTWEEELGSCRSQLSAWLQVAILLLLLSSHRAPPPLIPILCSPFCAPHGCWR